MADNNQNTLTTDVTIPTGQTNPKVLPTGLKTSLAHVSVGNNDNSKEEFDPGSNNNMEVEYQDISGKVVPTEVAESALMAELKKPVVPQKRIVFQEEPETKNDEEDADDDIMDEAEECAMIIDEQEVGEESKPVFDIEMAAEIDHLNLKPVVVTDQTRKESFLSCLGLVTKQALSELQNKKQTRKRRSTANPHFSNAAIEAKRINQLELAAKKARRKEQMAEMRSNKPARMSLYRQPDRHLKTLSLSDTNKAPRSKNSTSILEGAKKQPSTSGVSKVSCDCFICSEKCDTTLDVVMFCSDCKSLFHATCAASFDDIVKSGFVPCTKCDGKISMEDEVTSNEELIKKVTPQSVLPPPVKKVPTLIPAPVIKPSKSEKKSTSEKAEKEPKPKPAKKLKSERVSTNSNPSLVEIKEPIQENVDPQKESAKVHYELKRKELESLMEKKLKLEQEWNERKEKLENIRNTHKLIRDKSSRLEKSKKTVSDDIEKLVGFIRSVQIWKDIIDTDESNGNKQEQQMHQLPMTTSVATHSIMSPIASMAIGSHGQPITLNVPHMVVTANGQQLIASNLASIDKSNGQPVISSTVSSIGNRIISINNKAGIKTPVTVASVGGGSKVLTISGLPGGTSSNGTAEIMLQGNVIRNVSPGTSGWVTVPVGTLPGGQKILMPLSNVTRILKPGELPKTQVDLHRTNKPLQDPKGPYIPIMRPTIPLNNVKTYSGLTGGKVSTPEPQLVRFYDPQVKSELVSDNEINMVTSNNGDGSDIIIESIVQSEIC